MTIARISSDDSTAANGGMPPGLPFWIIRVRSASAPPNFQTSSTRLPNWAPSSFGPWQLEQSSP